MGKLLCLLGWHRYRVIKPSVHPLAHLVRREPHVAYLRRQCTRCGDLEASAIPYVVR
jgi:hypothetical protein